MDLATALNIAPTTAVVGGDIFGAWHIRVATRARETQISLQRVEMLQTRDLIEGLSSPQEVPEGVGWREIQSQRGDQWFSAFALINALDGLGILVFRREVSPPGRRRFFPSCGLGCLEGVRSAILERWQTAGRETAFQFLEWLAESQVAFRERPRKRSAYPLAQRSNVAAAPPG
jgi:hypothetical protein